MGSSFGVKMLLF